MYMVFSVGKQYYAIESDFLKKIMIPVDVTKIPTKYEYVMGSVIIEDALFTVLDMRILLRTKDMPELEGTGLFMAAENENTHIVLYVDAVIGLYENVQEKDLPLNKNPFLDNIILFDTDEKAALVVNIPNLIECVSNPEEYEIMGQILQPETVSVEVVE